MSSDSSLISIGELSRRVGAPPSALRYWERAGLLEAERVGGQRRYRPDAAERVGVIRLAQDAGFGVGEIRALLDVDPHGGQEWRAAGHAKLIELGAQIERLHRAAAFLEHLVACPHPSLDECPTYSGFVRWKAEGGDPPESAP
jgi:DNA-binding transcriptional MerR regulator